MLLDGKLLSNKIKKELKDKVEQSIIQYSVRPKMAIILVGNNPASQSYVSIKLKSAKEVGIDVLLIKKEESITENELIDLIKELNNQKDIHGFIVQLPLPKHINESEIINYITSSKDIDGMGIINRGKLFSERPCLYPATPFGVMQLLKHYQIELVGKEVLVIGRSNIVGKPMSLMLMHENATVTVAHSKTKDLKSASKRSDIIVVAAGKAKLVTADMVKPGAVIVDVGTNHVDGKLCGDVDYEPVSKIASYISPVPGGVGPLTVTSLLTNLISAYESQMSGKEL